MNIPKPQIDVQKAIALHDKGLTWKAIGELLAAEKGRSMPYQAQSVMRAVRAHDRRLVNA